MRKGIAATAAGLFVLGWIARPAAAGGVFQVNGAVSAGTALTDIAQAEELLDGTIAAKSTASGTSPVVNFEDPQYPGTGFHFSGKTPFVINTSAIDENFAIEAKGDVVIPTAGNYTFGVNSDDGFSVTIGSFSMSYIYQRVASDTLATFDFTKAGTYPVDLVYFQGLNASEVEFYASPGSYTTFGASGSNFQLVGGTASGALQLASVPEPASLGILAMTALPLLKRRRR